MAVRVAMVDPSGFTLPYDRALCAGLRAAGAKVDLYTRPARHGEDDHGGVAHFHRASERPTGRRLPDSARLTLKGAEYGLDAARLVALLKRAPPDVVHLQWMPVPLLDRAFVAALQTIAPVAVTVHDTRPFRGSPSSRLQELGWIQALRAADLHLVHTEDGRRRLAQSGIDDAIRVDHGLLPGPEEPSPHDGPLRLLLFGALKPYKGVDSAIAALERATTDVTLSIVGEARMDLPSSASERVRWDVRRVPDSEAAAVLTDADVHLFPYREIDASGALRTVLGRGGAVIATNIGGMRELLTDGEDALLVPPDDPTALAAAIDRLADRDLRERLVDGGRRTAASLPDWETIGRTTLEAYATVSR